MLAPRPLPISYVLTSTNHGTIITNRFDFKERMDHLGNRAFSGVGVELFESSTFQRKEIEIAFIFLQKILQERSSSKNKEEILVIDCGANIGIHTIEWANFINFFGSVISFEAQEKIYYALAGNIAINNLFNVKAINAAVGEENKKIKIPSVDYFRPSSFGALELKKTENTEFIGQPIDYENNLQEVDQITIDSLNLKNLNFMKIDVEGMEMEVLNGAKKSIKKFKPYLIIEFLKSDKNKIEEFLKLNDYDFFEHDINLYAAQKGDDILKKVKDTAEYLENLYHPKKSQELN